MFHRCIYRNTFVTFRPSSSQGTVRSCQCPIISAPSCLQVSQTYARLTLHPVSVDGEEHKHGSSLFRWKSFERILYDDKVNPASFHLPLLFPGFPHLPISVTRFTCIRTDIFSWQQFSTTTNFLSADARLSRTVAAHH